MSSSIPMSYGPSQMFDGAEYYRNPNSISYGLPPVKPPVALVYPPDARASRPIHVSLNPRADIPNRTPSPTPSENYELTHKAGAIDWNRVKSKEFWLSRKGIQLIIIITIGIAIGVLFQVFHKKIVDGLRPATEWCHQHQPGWLIPVAFLIVVSFPPLFGHEIIGMMIGIGWGLWVGFAIMAFGTLLGEIANFFVFKYCCTGRSKKYEKKSIYYACLSRVFYEGGFKVAVAARLSILPSHLTTGIFACSGMNFFTFVAAAICSLPKQFATVVWGVALADSSGSNSTKANIANIVVSVVTGIITHFALRYINRRVDEIKPQVIYERRKARQTANLMKLYAHDDDFDKV